MKQTNNWIKNCLGYSNNTYQTECGNGDFIKEYIEEKEAKKLPDGNYIIITKTVEKLDENGKNCYKNLYRDIQAQKDSVDFQKILDKNMTMDQIKLAIESNNKKMDHIVSEKYGDFSDFATIEKLQKIKNEANSLGKNYSNFVKNSNQTINKHNNIFQQYLKKKQELNEQKLFEKYNKKMGDKK